MINNNSQSGIQLLFFIYSMSVKEERQGKWEAALYINYVFFI